MSDATAKFFDVADRTVSTPSTPGIADYQQQRSLIIHALADARRQALIEAAEHLEASGEWKAVSIGPYGAATAEWDGPSVHELAAALRAKAEETQG